jgi:hypothetical protein
MSLGQLDLEIQQPITPRAKFCNLFGVFFHYGVEGKKSNK